MTNRIDSPDQAKGQVSDENFQFSSDFQREFNKACAEFVGFYSHLFNPLNDANDREVVIEKLGVHITPYNYEWGASVPLSGVGVMQDKSRRIAIIKCIAKVLGVAVDDEDGSPGAGGGL